MIEPIRSGILSIRRAARRTGIISLGHELNVHGIELPEISPGLAGIFKDAKRAELYARRYAELWRSKFNRLAADVKVSPEKAARLATTQTEFRLRSIAITEANRALNEEKRDVAIDLQARTRVQIYEVWDALRDACPACADYDGLETPVGEPFENGESPGWVHPNCQCESHYITR